MQLLSFYFIVLLNSKVAKFKDLEQRQDQLLREMDDTISLYLVEMKQENDRFLQQLAKVKATAPPRVQASEKPVQAPSARQAVPKEPEAKPQHVVQQETPTEAAEQLIVQAVTQPEEQPLIEEPRLFVPKNVAQRAYGQHVQMVTQPEEPKVIEEDKVKVLPSFEQQVIDLAQSGLSADEIAKRMQKGKTEIELLLKFHT